MAEGDSISRSFYALIMIGTLLAGTLNNITLKEQDETVYNGRKFYHPVFQTVVMFIAEFACLITFYISLRTNKEFKANNDKEEAEAIKNGIRTKNIWWIPGIPAFLDMTATILQMVSVSFIDQSIYMMLRGGVPIVTAGLSIIFLKKVLSKAQYLGLSLAVLGITIVGTYGYYSGKDHHNSNILIGLVCVIGSLFASGIQYTIEEKVLTVNHFHPLQLVGWEGVFGMFYSTLALIVANNIPCDANQLDSCNANGAVEDFNGAMAAMASNSMLLMWILVNMLALSFFNFFGVSVTKHVSALARSVLLITMTVFVWIYNLLYIPGSEFHWEQLVGFVITVTGNLIYQRVIKINSLEETTELPPPDKLSVGNFGKVSIVDPITSDVLLQEEVDDRTHTPESDIKL